MLQTKLLLWSSFDNGTWLQFPMNVYVHCVKLFTGNKLGQIVPRDPCRCGMKKKGSLVHFVKYGKLHTFIVAILIAILQCIVCLLYRGNGKVLPHQTGELHLDITKQRHCKRAKQREMHSYTILALAKSTIAFKFIIKS